MSGAVRIDGSGRKVLASDGRAMVDSPGAEPCCGPSGCVAQRVVAWSLLQPMSDWHTRINMCGGATHEYPPGSSLSGRERMRDSRCSWQDVRDGVERGEPGCPAPCVYDPPGRGLMYFSAQASYGGVHLLQWVGLASVDIDIELGCARKSRSEFGCGGPGQSPCICCVAGCSCVSDAQGCDYSCPGSETCLDSDGMAFAWLRACPQYSRCALTDLPCPTDVERFALSEWWEVGVGRMTAECLIPASAGVSLAELVSLSTMQLLDRGAIYRARVQFTPRFRVYDGLVFGVGGPAGPCIGDPPTLLIDDDDGVCELCCPARVRQQYGFDQGFNEATLGRDDILDTVYGGIGLYGYSRSGWHSPPRDDPQGCRVDCDEHCAQIGPWPQPPGAQTCNVTEIEARPAFSFGFA